MCSGAVDEKIYHNLPNISDLGMAPKTRLSSW